MGTDPIAEELTGHLEQRKTKLCPRKGTRVADLWSRNDAGQGDNGSKVQKDSDRTLDLDETGL